MWKNYRDLEVWKKAIQLVKKVYLLSQKYPKEEIYGLTSQLRRAAVSIPSNIAEGQARQSANEFKRFLNISKGSTAELDTQMVISKELDFITEEELDDIYTDIVEIFKMLEGLSNSIA